MKREINEVRLPQYICRKQEVQAIKIFGLINAPDDDGIYRMYLLPQDHCYSKILVSDEYVFKHKPEQEGYYVVSDDGSQSWASTEAFEKYYRPFPYSCHE